MGLRELCKQVCLSQVGWGKKVKAITDAVLLGADNREVLFFLL